jgi:hypothetical protein
LLPASHPPKRPPFQGDKRSIQPLRGGVGQR